MAPARMSTLSALAIIRIDIGLEGLDALERFLAAKGDLRLVTSIVVGIGYPERVR